MSSRQVRVETVNEHLNLVQSTLRSSDEFIAGLTAAFFNTTFLYPVNKLIFRQMAGGFKTLYAADQMKEEGLRFLYRGILPPLIQKMVSVSVMFGSFSQYRNWVDQECSNFHPVIRLAIASCLTGTTEAILTPLERVQMLLQDRKFHKDYRNTSDALIKMKKFGFKEYYRGLTCVLLRNGPSNILFFGLRDEVKNFLVKLNQNTKTESNILDLNYNNTSNMNQSQYESSDRLPSNFHAQSVHKSSLNEPSKSSDSLIYDFLSGSILGMFISTLFYPLSVVRTKMQTRAPGSEFLSIIQACRAVHIERDKRFSRFFHGCSINLFRQFLSWGIINCSYEMVLRFLHKF